MLGTGCNSQSPAPTGPTKVAAATSAARNIPVPPPVPSVSSPAANATVVVTSFEMTFDGMSGAAYVYRPSVELKETGGKSSVRITALWFSAAGELLGVTVDGPLGKGCLLTEESRVIPAGGTWTTDMVYPYCLDPAAWTDVRGQQGAFTMHYIDESGSTGVVSGTTTIR